MALLNAVREYFDGGGLYATGSPKSTGDEGR